MKNKFESIADIEQYMNAIPMFGRVGSSAANLSLDRIREFCDEMGNPQHKFPTVHVAGTNGKGTTSRMLASVLQQAGYKTGLYTSPHLIQLSERFRINGEMIPENKLLDFFNHYSGKTEQFHLTYFELTTVLAFWYFAGENADIAVIETGLGGRLDATNIIQPLVSVITSIGLDHTDILGDTIEKIAVEKGGIIKPNTPVVTGRLPEAANQVIQSIAKKNNSSLLEADTLHPVSDGEQMVLHTSRGKICVSLPGRKKVDLLNTAMAFHVVDLLQDTHPVLVRQFVRGMELLEKRFPNQVHFGKLVPGKKWYFDGAHNTEATTALIDELLSKAPPAQWTVILSFMKDKLNPEIGRLWQPFPNIKLYRQEGERAASIAEMNRVIPHATGISEVEIEKMLAGEQYKSELVIFSGSFYFYKKVSNWMGTIAAF